MRYLYVEVGAVGSRRLLRECESMINGFMKACGSETRGMYVVVVSTHPDDAELGAGGSIAVFLARGLQVLIVYITKGTAGIPGTCNQEARVKESVEACRILGVKKEHVFFAPFVDTQVPTCSTLISYLESFVRDPSAVYAVLVPSKHELHQDHRATADACEAAFRNIRTVLAYESPSSTADFAPNAFCDITGFLQKKRRALQCHKSQISQEKAYLDYKAMTHLAAFRGRQARGARYAEAFEVLRSCV